MKALYDSIGDDYDATRRPDPFLVSRLLYHLQPQPQRAYADFGCGTGNYTIVLHRQGVQIMGIDVSRHMLTQARAKESQINWMRAEVARLPFGEGDLAGGMAILTVHHWKDLDAGFAEISRVIRGGIMVLFTSLPRQMRGYWLNHYFPVMMERSMQQMPTLETLSRAFDLAGLQMVAKEKYFIEPDLQDKFLYCGKLNPSFYLDEQHRRGISSFRRLCPPQELLNGLDKLQQDISSGRIEEVCRQYENHEGDYLFIKLQA